MCIVSIKYLLEIFTILFQLRGFYYFLSRLTMLSPLVITVSIDSYKEQDNTSSIKGFNEPRYILIQTLNSNQNRSATLTIRTRRCNKKLIDNNQHCCNKKQYFLSLSLIMFKKKLFTPLVRANMTNAAFGGGAQRRAVRKRRGALRRT